MKVAFVCSSAYQVLNCINIRQNEEDIAGMSADIFLSSEMRGYKELCERLEQNNIFDNCFVYMDCKTRWESLGKKLTSVFLPKLHIKQNVIGNLDVKGMQYDIVFTSFPRYFSLALAFCMSKPKIYYFDEGVGSYEGDISHLPDFMNLLYRLGGHDLMKYRPEKLYVNNASCCKSFACEKIVEISRSGKEDYDKECQIESVFEFEKNKLAYNKRIIMLSQPNDEKSSITDEVNQRIYGILNKYANDLLVRLHPRQSLNEIPRGDYVVDEGEGVWELICRNSIQEDTILLGVFSSAQLTPKILYNKEPYIIFMYKFYPAVYKIIHDSPYETLINDFIEMYHDKDKIFIPESEMELKQLLEDIMREQNVKS